MVQAMVSKRLAVAALLLSAPLAAAQDGGIEIFAGETIFSQGTRVSLTEIWKTKEGLLRGSDSLPDTEGRTFTERRTVLGVNHGIARGWSVSALLPFVDRELESNTVNQRGTGVGDVSLILKQSFYRLDWSRSAWYTAWIAGVEMPTGVTDERAGGVKLSPSLQPGSGSWDPFVGLATTLDMDLYRFDAVALFKDNGEGAQDHEEGEKLSLSLSGKYRWLHERYPGPSASATVGLKWAHWAGSQKDGALLANSGGEELLFKFGLGWHPRPDMDLGLSLDLPLHEHLSGQQLGLDSRVQVSLGWRF